MLKKYPSTLSCKFVLFMLPLLAAAVVITGVVLTFHHYRFYNPTPSQLETLLLHTLFLLLLLIILLCWAAGVLCWFWISRQLQPVHRLQQHIRHLGDGRLDRTVAVDAPYEIKTLANAINEMAAALKLYIHGEIETARKTARRETETAQGTATRKIIHEMGNFLNNIDLVVYGLKPEQLSPRGQKILKILIDESGRIKTFFRRFLGFAITPELRLQPGCFEAILAGAVDEFKTEALEADIRIEISHLAAIPPVPVDAGQIQKVMHNLIRNSLDAVGRSGMIRIETTVAPSHLQIAVFDSGPGMDAETRTRAFEPFFTTRQTGDGAGLGLAISRTIIEAHAGTIDCEKTQGGGTAFRIRLPLS